MPFTRQEAEDEAIRRWYRLPPHLRASIDDAETYSYRLDSEIDFVSATGKRRLIGAWLIREFFRARAAEAAEIAALADAQAEDNLAEILADLPAITPSRAA
ncbi:MAG: hypothetical protein ABI697_08155 [Devosia sp.]